MKKSQLSVKLGKFYFNTESFREYLKGENRHQMRLQTDQEFNQNEIDKINKKYNVLHHNSKLNDGHAVGAEQKFVNLNPISEILRGSKRANLNPLRLKKTTNNINMFPTRKYGVPTEEVGKKSVESEEYKLDYDFKQTQHSILDTTKK